MDPNSVEAAVEAAVQVAADDADDAPAADANSADVEQLTALHHQLEEDANGGAVSLFLDWWHARDRTVADFSAPVHLHQLRFCIRRCFQFSIHEQPAMLGFFLRDLTLLLEAPSMARLCLEMDMLGLLAPKLMLPQDWDAGWYLYCAMLHCSSTREELQIRTGELGLDAKLFAALHLPLVAPPHLLLALNWFAGGRFGARCILPHVSKVTAAFKHVSSKREQRSLVLILANLPAYFDDEESAADRQALVHLRDDAQLISTLQPTALAYEVSNGSTGALMGLVNVAADLYRAGRGAPFPMRAHQALVRCLSTALKGLPEQNIIWSPWNPAQALAVLACDGQSVLYLQQLDAVPLFAKMLQPAALAGIMSAEPPFDELYACLTLARMCWHQPALPLPASVRGDVKRLLHRLRGALATTDSGQERLFSRAEQRCARAALRLAEQIKAPAVVQSLAVLCRQKLHSEFFHVNLHEQQEKHTSHSAAGADREPRLFAALAGASFSAWAQRQHIPTSVRNFLGEMP